MQCQPLLLCSGMRGDSFKSSHSFFHGCGAVSPLVLCDLIKVIYTKYRRSPQVPASKYYWLADCFCYDWNSNWIVSYNCLDQKSVNLKYITVGQLDNDMIVPPSDGAMFILIDWESFSETVCRWLSLRAYKTVTKELDFIFFKLYKNEKYINQ